MTLREQIQQMVDQREQKTTPLSISGGFDLNRFGVDLDVFVVSGRCHYEHEADDPSKSGTFRPWRWNAEVREFERLSDDYFDDKVACIEAVINAQRAISSEMAYGALTSMV